jgi:HK97 family phage portal protein
MAWNSFRNKSLGNSASKALGVGAPISLDPGRIGKPYHDMWDIERAYREGFQKITWVQRCIDAIAGNQARLPIILRKDNSRDGEVLVGRRALRSPLIEIFNTRANEGENSFIFRYRLTSQLLMSSRGAFIEKIKGRDGRLIGLNLLPPQHTAPIPDAKRFVSGFEVKMPNGGVTILKPDDVMWIRRPHPLDPYLSLTPMESAGIAIEIENLAKVYNRNYLINDGRPGGILVVKGEIDDDDKDELRNRFRGNVGRAGHTTVISSDEGVDYVDTSASPRDAAYVQMRQIQKEEILAAFGVPESVIGNASGRTFSNAAEEHRVFWNETMLPHLDLLARAFDELDEVNYVDFDVESVPILILYKQERSRYFMDEVQMGLISPNEYREATSRKKVESDLADSLLMNPNLTPIANTEKKMEQQPQAGMPGMPPGAPGMPPDAGMPPADPNASPLDPNTMAGALAEQGAAPNAGAQPSPDAGMSAMPPTDGGIQSTALPPGQQLSAEAFGPLETKEDSLSLQRWTAILNRALERTIERQQRVTIEKVNGVKARKALVNGSLAIDMIFNTDIWDRQFEEDIRPVLSTIISDSSEYSEKSLDQSDVVAQLNAQIQRLKEVNQSTYRSLHSAYVTSLNVKEEEQRSAVFRSSCVSIFSNILAKSVNEISNNEARRAWAFAN